MTDQEKLEYINKYRNNPLTWVKDMYPEIKLYPWQEAFLRLIYAKDKFISYVNPYRNGKDFVYKKSIEHMKAMEMDFNLVTKEGIEVYEKGELVKIEKFK